MLVLYHASHSTCSQKVRLVLHEKGLAFDEVRLDLGKKDQLKPEYLAINPNAVVPTLVDDGIPIIESSVICEYLDEKYPHNRWCRRTWSNARACGPGPITSRRSRSRRSACRRSTAPSSTGSTGSISSSFEDQQVKIRKVRKELFQRMGSPQGFSRADIDRSLEQLGETCRRMDEAIARQGPWIMGAQFTLADVLVMPSIDRMADLGLVPCLGGQVSARLRMVRAPATAAIVPGDLLSRLARLGVPDIPPALCGRPRVELIPKKADAHRSAVTMAPRSMKVGTIRSPRPKDAATRHTLQSVNLRRPAILHLVGGCLPDFAGWSVSNSDIPPAMIQAEKRLALSRPKAKHCLAI